MGYFKDAQPPHNLRIQHEEWRSSPPPVDHLPLQCCLHFCCMAIIHAIVSCRYSTYTCPVRLRPQGVDLLAVRHLSHNFHNCTYNFQWRLNGLTEVNDGCGTGGISGSMRRRACLSCALCMVVWSMRSRAVWHACPAPDGSL